MTSRVTSDFSPSSQALDVPDLALASIDRRGFLRATLAAGVFLGAAPRDAEAAREISSVRLAGAGDRPVILSSISRNKVYQKVFHQLLYLRDAYGLDLAEPITKSANGGLIVNFNDPIGELPKSITVASLPSVGFSQLSDLHKSMTAIYIACHLKEDGVSSNLMYQKALSGFYDNRASDLRADAIKAVPIVYDTWKIKVLRGANASAYMGAQMEQLDRVIHSFATRGNDVFGGKTNGGEYVNDTGARLMYLLKAYMGKSVPLNAANARGVQNAFYSTMSNFVELEIGPRVLPFKFEAEINGQTFSTTEDLAAHSRMAIAAKVYAFLCAEDKFPEIALFIPDDNAKMPEYRVTYPDSKRTICIPYSAAFEAPGSNLTVDFAKSTTTDLDALTSDGNTFSNGVFKAFCLSVGMGVSSSGGRTAPSKLSSDASRMGITYCGIGEKLEEGTLFKDVNNPSISVAGNWEISKKRSA